MTLPFSACDAVVEDSLFVDVHCLFLSVQTFLFVMPHFANFCIQHRQLINCATQATLMTLWVWFMCSLDNGLGLFASFCQWKSNPHKITVAIERIKHLSHVWNVIAKIFIHIFMHPLKERSICLRHGWMSWPWLSVPFACCTDLFEIGSAMLCQWMEFFKVNSIWWIDNHHTTMLASSSKCATHHQHCS